MTKRRPASRKVNKKRNSPRVSLRLVAHPKSSPKARRLCRAALRKRKTLRGAAKLLKLKDHNRLVAILSGRIADTPDMKAALKRGQKRGDRAFYFVEADDARISCEQLAEVLRRLKEPLAELEALIEACRAQEMNENHSHSV